MKTINGKKDVEIINTIVNIKGVTTAAKTYRSFLVKFESLFIDKIFQILITKVISKGKK